MSRLERALRLLPAIVLLGAAGLAIGQTREQEYRARGTGLTMEEAIENALFEVTRKVSGTRIEGTQSSSVHTVSGNIDGTDGGSEFRFEERVDSRVRTSASGLVSSYDLLSRIDGPRGVEVEILARVPRYDVPGIDSTNRRKLALIPFGSRIDQTEFFGPIYGDELASELSNAVLTQFVQARRFAILDRESWRAIDRERELLASSATPISEKAKLGRALGADYLVLGELLEAGGGQLQRTDRLTGAVKSSSGASIAVAYRIVVPATGEIKFADTVELSVSDASGQPVQSRTYALNELSKQLVGIALDRIYPIKVVGANGADVVLNQGGNTLSIGDQLELIEVGELMRDPYTKESLGRVETVIGRLEITRVDGKMSYARIVGHGAHAPKVGQLARRDLGLYGAGIAAPPVPPPTPRSEGVRLPFDR